MPRNALKNRLISIAAGKRRPPVNQTFDRQLETTDQFRGTKNIQLSSLHFPHLSAFKNIRG
jgi:hypothetical protein